MAEPQTSPKPRALTATLFHALRDAGALLGGFFIVQSVLWWAVSPHESLVFLFWSQTGIESALVAFAAGIGLLVARFARASWDVAGLVGAALVLPGVVWALSDAMDVWYLGLTSPHVQLHGLGWWPLSLTLTLALAVPIGLALWGSSTEASPWRWWSLALRGAIVLMILMAMTLQAIVATGQTDYRRSADTAVILGARAYRDLTPSEALRDRIMTGVHLYHQGKVRRLVMTGGMSEGKVSEAQVMKRYAVQEGVPSNAIVLDEKGDNTAASIRNLARLKKTQKLGALLVVSHDYHTLRLKLSCHRLGLTCYTVPAVQERRLRAEPYYVVREVAAVLYYALLFR